jgi:predicted small lipoprotein YifL
MKKSILLLMLPLLATLFLAGCGSQQPLTEQEQATNYGWTLEEYRENKQAAARMNMTIEEHVKMLEEEGDMDMDDDMDMDMDDDMDM